MVNAPKLATKLLSFLLCAVLLLDFDFCCEIAEEDEEEVIEEDDEEEAEEAWGAATPPPPVRARLRLLVGSGRTLLLLVLLCELTLTAPSSIKLFALPLTSSPFPYTYNRE